MVASGTLRSPPSSPLLPGRCSWGLLPSPLTWEMRPPPPGARARFPIPQEHCSKGGLGPLPLCGWAWSVDGQPRRAPPVTHFCAQAHQLRESPPHLTLRIHASDLAGRRKWTALSTAVLRDPLSAAIWHFSQGLKCFGETVLGGQWTGTLRHSPLPSVQTRAVFPASATERHFPLHVLMKIN